MNAFLTGLEASQGLSPSSVLLAVHAGFASIIMFLSNMFINYFLSKHHSPELTRAERNTPSQKVFNMKIIFILVVLVFVALLCLIFFQQRWQQFPIGGVILSLITTLVNFYFAQKRKTVNYFGSYLKYQNLKLAITVHWSMIQISFTPIPVRVSPQPYPIEP